MLGTRGGNYHGKGRYSWSSNAKSALEDQCLLNDEIRRTKMGWAFLKAVRLQFDDQKSTDMMKDRRMSN